MCIGAPLRLRWQVDQVRKGAEDAQPPPRLRGSSLLSRVWVIVQGAPGGLNGSVLEAAFGWPDPKVSRASSVCAAPRACYRDGAFLFKRTPLLLLLRLLDRSSFVISCPSHPSCLAQVGWAGLGLGKDGGGGRCRWTTHSETRSRVPHTPASPEARAGNRGGRGCALPCCSLPTQVLHRRSPGGTEVARAAAAFKYRPEPPRAHRVLGCPGR